MLYNKPPLSFSQQLGNWRNRGLIVNDTSRAIKYLSYISYYRLSAYALPFQQIKDHFNTGTTFDDILELYVFDRKLRLLTLDAIERIEVALRAQFIYQLSHFYKNSHWQDDPALFNSQTYKNKFGHLITNNVYGEIQKIINDHCNSKYPEVFIDHYLNKYTSPITPPSWMAIELLTMGQLSRLFNALKSNSDKTLIASEFSIHYKVFENWLHALSYGRNLCAHHSRFWNRDFVIQPMIPHKLSKPWLDSSIKNNRRCFYFLSVIKYFLNIINPTSDFKSHLEKLISEHPKVPIKFLGIPTDSNGKLIIWQNEPVWKK